MFFTRSSLAMEKTMGFNRLFNIPMCSSFYSGALKSFSVEPCGEIIYLYYKKSEICRDPPDDMGRSPLSGLTLSVPPRGHVARTFIRDPPGQGGHDTLSYLGPLYGSLTVRSKPCWVIPDSLSQPTFHRLQSERTGAMASHLPRSLIAAYKVMMTLSPPWGHHAWLCHHLEGIMTSQKVFPPLKRGAELLTLYKRVFTQRRR